jgi:hypothetical protein
VSWFTCLCKCLDCQLGTTPGQIQLTVPAGTYADATSPCDEGCGGLEGTFILDQTDDDPCVWELNTGIQCTIGMQSFEWSYRMFIVTGGPFLVVELFDPPADIHVQFTSPDFSFPLDCAFSGLASDHFINNLDIGCVSSTGKTVTLDLPP